MQKKLKNDSAAISSSSSLSLVVPIEQLSRTTCAEESNNSNSTSDESGNSANGGKVELTTAQVLVLQSINELTLEEARKEFLCTLFAAFPYWKYDNFL